MVSVEAQAESGEGQAKGEASALNTSMPSTTWRHRWLTRRRIIAALCCVAALWLGWQVYDILSGKPNPKVDYATPFYELMESAQESEGENGWDLYARTIRHMADVSSAGFLAAKDAHDARIAAEREADQAALEGEQETNDPIPMLADPDEFLTGDDYYPEFGDITRGSIDLAAWTPHLEIIASLEADGSFEALAQVRRMSRLVPPRPESGSLAEAMQLFDVFRHEREAVRLAAARLRLAAHAGDWDEFVRLTDESLVLAVRSARRPTLLQQMISGAIVSLLTGEVCRSVLEFEPPDETCLQLARIIESSLPLPRPEYYLEGERLYSLDTLQRTYTASGRLPISAWGKHRGDFPWEEEPRVDPVRGAIGDALAITVPGHETAAEWTSELLQEAIEFSKKPLRDRLIEEFAASRPAESLPINQVVLKEHGFSFVSSFMRSAAKMECEHKALVLMLLIEAHRARHGAPPAGLDDLVPEFLDVLPVDSASGKGYGYRLLTDDPHGRTYLLYSFGVDGEDNGGHEEPMKSWHHPADVGVDYVINRPRSAAP